MACRTRGVAVFCAVVGGLAGCHKSRAETKVPRSLQLRPAIFVRESLAATREALYGAYRLALDTRLPRALSVVAEMVGAPLKDAPTTTWVESAHAWDVKAAGESLGRLDELCDFAAAHALLLDWASKQIATHPLMEDPRPLPAVEPLFDEAAVKTARRGGKLWGAPASRAHAIHVMSTGLLSLALQSLDAMDAADALLAAAWATTALDEATGHVQPAQKMVLAYILGYRRAAQQAAAWVPDNNAVRAYVLGDDRRLAALAGDSGSDSFTRYLWLRRLLLDDRHQEAESFLVERMAEVRSAAPVLQARVTWGDFQTKRSLASSGPAVVLRSLMRDAGGKYAERASKAMESQDEHRILRQLDVDNGKLLGTFDEVLAALASDKSDPSLPAIEAYHRAAMLTALRDKGNDYLHTLCSNEAAAAFARSFGEDKGRTAAIFSQWFDWLVAADAGQNVTGELLANLESLPGIGGLALKDVFDAIEAKLDWAEPASRVGARALMARLDSRPTDRELVGKVAHRLPDLRLYERMQRGLIEAAPGMAPSAQASFAAYTGEKALLEQTAALPRLLPCDRIHLAATRVDLGFLPPQAGMREMEAMALADKEGPHGLLCLIGVLEHVGAANKLESWWLLPAEKRNRKITKELSKDPDGAIVRLAQRWLDDHPDPRGLDGANVRGRLAAALRRMRKPKEALLAIEPAVSTGQAGAMKEAAINLALLDRADPARSLGERLVTRYPGASSVAAQAAIEWRLGNHVEAARLLRQSGKRGLKLTDSVAVAFVDAFIADKVPGLDAALAELGKAGLVDDVKNGIIDALVRADVKRALAVIDQIVDPRQRQYNVVRHYDAIRFVKGEDAAQTLGRQVLRAAPWSISQVAVFCHREEPLWLLPEPPSPQGRDLLWLFRAVAAQWSPRSVYRDALARHFAKPSPDGGTGSDRYYVLGRLVMGLESEAVGTSLRGTTPSASCEVAFYLGARAQGLGKLDEAYDWYRTAVETALPQENEYRFSLAQLALWSRENKSLSRITKEAMP